MAVWIEDADGNFVKTIALYHKANGDNWLNSLASWYASSGATDTTTSGTVPAGSFTAVWDGTTASGERAAQGEYYICIESAVEHGSESLIREKVSLGTSANQVTLSPNGELTAASVTYAA
jgi:Predicted periplasmic protein